MKILRVDMTGRHIHSEEVPEAYEGLGGRGLTSIMVNSEVPPECDPLGAENKLVFAPGFLSGTPFSNTGRLSVGAKSPLTGGIKESNVGGNAAEAIAGKGIAAIVVEGKAGEGDAGILCIDERGEARIESAAPYKGMGTYETAERLLETYGAKNSILLIGPAGEYMLSSASVQCTDVEGRPSRAAGRGGMGAVMGAKGLKAIVIDQQGKSPAVIADPKAFKEAARNYVAAVKAHPFSGQALPALGTAVLVGIINSTGAFPSYNATKGTLEGWEKISGETMAQTIEQRGGRNTHRACSKCIIHCSQVYVDKKGKYLTSGLEYETIWAMGGMTDIKDLDYIARLDFLSDDIGVDTMNTGVALAVAMDAGHIPFGDGEAAVKMVSEIAEGTELGKVLGNGPDAVGKHFNHHRVPTVKRQSIAGYDPRGMQGMGVTYATSPMGADHTAGNLIDAYLGGQLDPLATEGQVEASRNAQIALAALDSTGLCLMAGPALSMPEGVEAFTSLIGAKIGKSFTMDDFGAMGVRVLTAELDFNRRAGFTSADDRLPDFFREESLSPHNKVFEIEDAELDKTLQL